MAAKVNEVMEILQAISNGVSAYSDKHKVSKLMLWMLVKSEADRQIERLDTNYE